jgi:thiamine-phosphate pyrophosphorylase
VIPALHIVSDDDILRRPDYLSLGEGILEAGGHRVALHLRGPGTSCRVLHSLGVVLKDMAARSGSRVLVNDRVDIALGLDLAGVHLGQRSLPPSVARELLGPDRVLGLSVHGMEEVGEGAAGTLDYLIAGTVFATASHPGRAPGGLARIREIRDGSPLPVLAIGGITRDRVPEVLDAGAAGVAVRGGVWDAPDPIDALLGYLEALGKE